MTRFKLGLYLASGCSLGWTALLLTAACVPLTRAQAQGMPVWQQRHGAGRSLMVSADFANDQDGWAVGLNSISHTVDGGQDWGAQWKPGQPNYWFNSVAALSPQVALVTGFPYGRDGGGLVLRTTDGGANWVPLLVGKANSKYHSLCFRAGDKTGYLVSNQDGLMKTTDGGLTWYTVATPQSVNGAFIAARGVIALPDAKTVYVGADHGVLLHSSDDGMTWNKISMPAPANEAALFSWIRFADAKDGWVNPLGQAIWETRDGGQSWKKSVVPGIPYFTDAKSGWAVNNNLVSQTKDGGQNWINATNLNAPANVSAINLTGTTRRLFALGGNEGMGLSYLADRLLPGIKADGSPLLHAPIPIHFHLEKPGMVTLVIEDKNGTRVRNLVSQTAFPAGENLIYWDGLDESGRINEAPNGVYDVQGKMVAAGVYTVRGLVHDPLKLRYQFTLYNAGQVPWATADKSSEWLTNHTPPCAVAYLAPDRAPARAIAAPAGQILVGSQIAEGGSGLAWIDAQTGHKLHGQMWVGGVWTGASQLAVDEGAHPVPGVYAYTGSSWPGDKYNGGKSELRLHELLTPDQKRANSGAWGKNGWDPDAQGQGSSDARMGTGEDRPLLQPNFEFAKPLDKDQIGISGMAVHNGILVVSLPPTNQLLFVDARAHKTLGRFDLTDPRGLAFDKTGHLLALSGTQLLRYSMPTQFDEKIRLGAPQVLVTVGLQDPQGLALDKAGNIYISNRGALHQVKVFAGDGRFLRAIGHAGVPSVGPYDPQQMHNPAGLTIAQTPEGERLWVAEQDFKPKRLSEWTTRGAFVKAFYGPTIYGGGGNFDPADKTRFFHDGMEFSVDWKTGANVPVNIYYRPKPGDLQLPVHMFNKEPETPIRTGGGLYVTDAYTGNPTNGCDIAGIFQMRKGVAHLVAAAGLANEWDELKKPAFVPCLPTGADLSKNGGQPGATTFVWSDLNGDGKIQANELQFRLGWHWGGVTVLSDLSLDFPDSSHLLPTKFTADGVPCYDLSQASKRFDWKVAPTSGGGQILDFPDGYSVATAGPIQGFKAPGHAGVLNSPTWTYPNQWPGLHASHYARVADAPGEILGATRLLGLPMTFSSADVTDKAPFHLWGINGNMGNEYLMTSDGLMVASLFKDFRQAKAWPDQALPGMSLNDVSLGGESFFNTITQTAEGGVYVQNSSHIISVDGLNSLRRLPVTTISVTPQLLAQAQDYYVRRDAHRLAATGGGNLTVVIRDQPPVLDGKLDDWADANWVQLDAKTSATAAVSGNMLYLAYKTGYPDLLKNAPESLPLLFKTGGALDLQIGAEAIAPDNRTAPVLGDQRLLITRVKDKTVAMRYRPLSSGEKNPVQFASPARTITFDRVDDVSSEIQLVQGKAPIEEFHAGNVFGNRTDKYEGTSYEVAIPLTLLDLKPVVGQTLRGDLGILLGNGFQTIQRIYWNNKATGLVSDIPGEAMLTPQLWGKWTFKATP